MKIRQLDIAAIGRYGKQGANILFHRFFTTCRDDLDDLNKRHVVVRETGRTKETIFWKTPVYHRMRPLETVHFDSAVKNDLVADIASYNSQECRTYYKTRGIPYRRGYLLHGPPGTGKTSLCVALASHFHVSLYIMHLPSIANDSVLSEFFKYLPEKCFVVLEDIDAVGLDHRTANPGNSPKDICTLSGLLNVLDGVASSEGRIILMTTNFIDRLDAALLRPGRIDKKIYLGKLERPAAKEMFLRMYKSDKHIEGTASSREIGDLDLMAEEFSRKLPEHTLTPAQLQGYLLANRKTPEVVVAGIQEWAEHELEDARKKREEYEAIVNAEARGQGAVRPQVIQSQEPPSAAQSSETANNATEIDVKERKDEQPNGQVNEQDEKTAETKEDGKTTDQKDEGSSGQDVVNTPESPTSSDSDYHSVGDNTEEAKPSDSKPTETTAA
jgi:chaperone BCS1